MILVLAGAALFVVAWAALFVPYGVAGIRLDAGPNGPYVASYRGAAAMAAGIRVGDLVDVRALSYSERLRLVAGTVSGGVLRLRVAHPNEPYRDVAVVVGPAVTGLDALAGRLPIGRTALLLARVMVSLIAFGVAALIGWRRPSFAAASILFYACGTISARGTAALFAWLPDPLFGVAAWIVLTLCAQLPSYAFLLFLTWFPDVPVTAAQRRRATVAFGILAVAFVVEGTLALTRGLFLPALLALDDAESWIAPAMVIAFAVLAFASTAGENRHRIGWVLAGVGVSALALTTENFVDRIPVTLIDSDVRQWTLVWMTVLQSSFYFALAYAVLRHRVLDIGFVLNRTLVYGVLTTVVVIVVSLVDWLCGHFISATKFALAFEALVAVALGLALNRLHRVAERFVDRVVFRERHVAETRMRQRAVALAFAENESSIDATLACDARTIMRLSSGAVFRRDPDGVRRFIRMAADGWGDGDTSAIETSSMLARSLMARTEPVVLPDLAIDHPGLPSAAARPALAVPILFQAELVGFALYGPHDDGTMPDPEEIGLLAHLAATAGGVYEIVELRRWRRSVTAPPPLPVP